MFAELTNIETTMLSNLNCNDDFDVNDDYAGQVESEHLKLGEEEKWGGEGGRHDQGHQGKADRLERRELTTATDENHIAVCYLNLLAPSGALIAIPTYY